MIVSDLHTHTLYSHGECSVRQVMEAARAAGLKSVAISEHSTANRFYGLTLDEFFSLRDEIGRLNDELDDGFKLLFGVELNLLGDGKIDLPEGLDFDVRILGYHKGIIPKNVFAARALAEAFGLGRNAKKNTDEFIRAIDNNEIDIIAHPGLYIRIEIERLARAAAARGVLLEINGRRVPLTADELKCAADCGVKFIINSDAHKPEELCDFDKAVLAAREAGILGAVINWVDKK